MFHERKKKLSPLTISLNLTGVDLLELFSRFSANPVLAASEAKNSLQNLSRRFLGCLSKPADILSVGQLVPGSILFIYSF